MSLTAFQPVRLGEVLAQSDRAIASSELPEVNLAGVYSFARGLFKRGPMRPAETSYKAYNRLVRDDFVISQPKAWEGALARVTDEFDGWFLSPVFPTFTANPRRLLPAYLEWFCKRKSVWQDLQILSKGMGARRETVSPDQFLSLEIPLPPLDEQRRIVARIEALAAKVEEASGLRALSKDGTSALTTSAAAHTLDGLTKAAARLPLGSLVSIRGGGTPSKDAPHYWGGDVPWITPKDMKRRVLADSIDHITEIASKESPAKLIDPGAVLVVVRGMILAHTFPVAMLQATATINQDMKALIPDARVLAEYLCAVLWAWNPRVLDLVDRSGHDTRKLNTDKLLAFKIPVPSISAQKRVIAELDALQSNFAAVKALQTETAAELDAMLPAILDKAFKGEL
jgi:type I restriction enzyme, S subunit